MRIPDFDVCGEVSGRINMRTDRILYISREGKRRWTGGGRGGQVPEAEIALGLWDGCVVEVYRGKTVAERVCVKRATIQVWKDHGDSWRGEIV